LTNELITIADEQLVRLLKTQGMLCLPLVCSDRRVGVICAGIDELQFPLLWEQQELLNSFAAQAAALLDRTRVADVQPPYVKETGRQFDEQAVRRVLHEVNNPLGIVKNYLNLLADNPSVKDEVDLIRQEIERIPDIIAQLSKTRYKDSAADESVDINAIIEDLSKIMIPPGRQAPITLTFDPDRNLPPFLGKRSHLEQVFINLLKNCIEAMPKGGRIHISTAYEAKETDVSGGDITVLIRDDGPGIPAKKLERIFEPGVSSKGSEHEGLGLAVSKEIIVDYGGTIGCRHRKDRGTVFRITLPVSSRNP
jgi:signal transduction histidine kinase